MKSDFVFLQNRESLKELHKKNTPFYLIYRVGSTNDIHLKLITDECIHIQSCLGIAFSVDKEKQFFDDLFFLKTIIEKLLSAKKRWDFGASLNVLPENS